MKIDEIVESLNGKIRAFALYKQMWTFGTVPAVLSVAVPGARSGQLPARRWSDVAVIAIGLIWGLALHPAKAPEKKQCPGAMC